MTILPGRGGGDDCWEMVKEAVEDDNEDPAKHFTDNFDCGGIGIWGNGWIVASFPEITISMNYFSKSIT